MSRIPHCIANPSSTTHALLWEIEFSTHSQQTEYYLYILPFVSPVHWPISAVLSSVLCPLRSCTAVDCPALLLSRIITFRHFHESPLTNYWHPWPLAFDWSPTVPALEELVTLPMYATLHYTTTPGGSGPRIYIPQEEGTPVITPDTGFPFCRLLRLAGMRWRYSNPPPHGYVTTVKVKGAHLRPATNFSVSLKCSFRQLLFVILYRPLWREDGSVIYCCCWACLRYVYSLSTDRTENTASNSSSVVACHTAVI
jgi:hypothetical protein